MPRPTRLSRTPCAILSLSCAAATLILPTVAKADVTILSTGQIAYNSINQGEGPFGQNWLVQRSEWEDLDILSTFTASPGLRPISTTTQYRSTLVPGPSPRGSVSMMHRIDPGFVPLSDPNEPSLSLWAQSARGIPFSTTEAAQVQLRATAYLDSPEAFYAACGVRILPADPEAPSNPPLSWSLGGPTPGGPTSASLDHTITLPPGAWQMIIYADLTDLAASRESLAFPSTINLDASFAIIPAPASIVLLLAGLGVAASRRRRA